MDFYTALAAEALKKPYDAVTPEERERAKAYWYARLYDSNTNLHYMVNISSTYTDVHALVTEQLFSLQVLIPAPIRHNRRTSYVFSNAQAAFDFLCMITSIEYPPHDIHITCCMLGAGQKDFQ